MKDIKTTKNQRTFRPQIPGRVAMALLRTLRPGSIGNISLGNMILSVEIREPSSLDWIFGMSVAESDFREEGFGIVRLYGPLIFKWEMCVSEQGKGPVEGVLSVTVGGWSTTDRFGREVVKQSIDPRSSKKQRVSSGSERKQGREKEMGTSKVQVAGKNSSKENCDENSCPDQNVGSSASTKGKGMLYSAHDRVERYQRRMQQQPGIVGDNPCDEAVNGVLNVGRSAV